MARPEKMCGVFGKLELTWRLEGVVQLRSLLFVKSGSEYRWCEEKRGEGIEEEGYDELVDKQQQQQPQQQPHHHYQEIEARACV